MISSSPQRDQNTFELVRYSIFRMVLLSALTVNPLLLIYQIGIEQMPLSSFEVGLRIALTLLAGAAIFALQSGTNAYLISQIVIAASIALLFVTETAVEALAVGTFVLVVAALFANTSLLAVAVIAYFAQLILLSNGEGTDGQPLITSFEMILVALLMVMTIGLMRYFVSRMQRTIGNTTRSAELLHATSTIGQIAARTLNEKTMFDQIVELLRDQFGYYHVQVFLVDESRANAQLVASTGSIGRELLHRGHQLAVGSQSVVGRVTQLGEPIVAYAEQGSIHARNELLPHTRSELALPLMDGDQVIGALDVQSTELGTFSEEDVQALQVMANQLAIAILNARLFKQQDENTKQNQRLLEEARAANREIERLNSQLTGSAWREFLKSQDVFTGITLDGEEENLSAEWSQQMIAAQEQMQPVVEDNRFAIPIVLRGEVLGSIELDTNNDVRRDDALEVVESVMNRLAFSLENARLFQTAQDTTAQEQRINEIVGKFQNMNSVDDLLETTLKELSETLGATTGMIRLTGRTGDILERPVSENGSHRDGDRST